MEGKKPVPKKKTRSSKWLGIAFCSVVVLILLQQSWFFGGEDKRVIIVSNDERFKLKRSGDSHVHERRELRLILRKNQSYTVGESIDQVIVTKLLGNRVAEQKQNIKMAFVIHVERIVDSGAHVRVTCTKFEIVSLSANKAPYKAHLWERMEQVVVGSTFSAFLSNNGTMVRANTTRIHREVFGELHKLGALPMELQAILTVPVEKKKQMSDNMAEESMDCLGTRFINRPSGKVRAPMVLGQPRTGCVCAPPIGSGAHRWEGSSCRFQNDVKGKIVVLVRGQCNFADKIILAQSSGAVGVVVGDTVERDLVYMGGQSKQVHLPAVMVRKGDYERIVNGIVAYTEGGTEYVGTLMHGLDAYQYNNESPSDTIDDLLGYNYLLEDQLKKRLTIFPKEPVAPGDSWERKIFTETPMPHVNYEKYTLQRIFRRQSGNDYRWVARIQMTTKESPAALSPANPKAPSDSNRPRAPLISSASSHNLNGSETGLLDIDLATGILLNGQVTQSISGTQTQQENAGPQSSGDPATETEKDVDVETKIHAFSNLCSMTDIFGDCSKVLEKRK